MLSVGFVHHQVGSSTPGIVLIYSKQRMTPLWPPPSRRGRGRIVAGRGGHIFAQIGNKQLIAANSASTSGLNIDHPMYKEFLDFMQSKQGKDNIPVIFHSSQR